ncbi:carbohydrate porin [Vibrio sp. DW001]|uniref:carbohydrate porin n=1 Tax=Vibrio sp. DW001 TaxID=2912315 RepID=UPI0023AEC295|nr:carbohydrate porin [Vibrio sp. DW001]WED28357.1 carbohydrate porin [Vibrio sp. DW001]
MLVGLSISSSLISFTTLSNAGFSGPDSVENTISENVRPKQSWRERLALEQNITFGLDYQMLTLSASNPTIGGDDNASSGVLRFYGSWGVLSQEVGTTGSLVWKVEHRHAYSDLSPKEFSFIGNGLGYAGMIGPAYSDQGGRLTNLYWKQMLNSGRSSFMVGYLDTTDYVDTYALASPWTGFTNLAFSTGGGAIGLPDDGILGLAIGHMLTDNYYVVAGVADGKGESDDPLEGFDTLFNDHKLFSTLELGWTASQENIYTDNIHVTAWHLDGGTQHNLTNSSSGQGINFSASYFATSQIMPFLRGGFSKGDVALYDTSITIGLGYFELGAKNNNLGFALNWSEVNENLEGAYGVESSEQLTTEVYYNIAVSPFIQITPDVQYIKDPAFSSEDNTWVFGLRARIFI